MRESLVVSLVLLSVCTPLSFFEGPGLAVDGTSPPQVAPIAIQGDPSLLQNASIWGWGGSGSQNDPIVISGYGYEGLDGPAIWIMGTTLHIVIRSCSIRDINGTGILISGSRNVAIIGNGIDNVTEGIRLSEVEKVTVSMNWIEGCGSGIVGANITSCSFFNETILGAKWSGLTLTDSSDCSISSCVIRESVGYGIELKDSISNRISLNSLMFNRGSDGSHAPSRLQAFDGTGFNVWVTPEGKGNHWTDHLGPDLDLNGIVDEPYLVDGSNVRDDFPLTRSPTFIASPPPDIEAFPYNGRIILSWGDPDLTRGGLPIGSFSIYRSITGSLFELLSNTQGKAFEDTGLENGRQYSYKIASGTEIGEGSLSNEVRAIPDGTGPALSLIDPQEGEFLNESHVFLDIEITMEDISRMDVTLDGGIPWNVTIHRTIDMGDLIDGQHTIEVRAYDRSSNPSTADVTFSIDTVAPEMTISELPEYVRNGSLSISTIALDGNGIIRTWCELDGQYEGESLNGTIHLDGLSEGPHRVEVKALDPALNQASASDTFTVDLTGPVIVVINPSSGSVHNSTQIPLDIIVSDNISGVLWSEYRLDNGDWIDLVNGTVLAGDGHHMIEVRVQDRAGWRSTRAIGFEVSIDISVPGNGTVLGRVIGHVGEPITGVKIEVDGNFSQETGPDGLFSIQMAPGIHRLTFYRSGRFAAEVTVEVRPDIELDVGDITLSGNPVASKGPSTELIAGTSALVVLLIFLLVMVYVAADRYREADIWGEE